MDDQKYLIAKRDYHNAHLHLESLREKQRKSTKRINHLNAELEQQQSKLQTIDERLERAVEKFRLAKEIYGPLKAQWKESHPKEPRSENQP
jgi:predicted  nucleic acid-binding Zn-ribbon protein